MHFFIDQGELTAQQAVDAFGPDSVNPTNLYNVTSRFQLVNQAKAFACEAGMMIVQQSAVDPTLVNLIIKPNLNVNALADVAYYVYRGVLKNSLIVGSSLQNTGADNELLTRIRGTNPLPMWCGGVGYDQGTIADSDTIESMFDCIRVSTPVFVKEGEWIGTFGTGFKIGFEVLLNTQRFSVTFGYVRAERYQVKVTGLAGMALRIKREEILNFVDPVAFFGLHFDQKVGYSEYNPNKVTNQTTTTVGNAGFIYAKLLDKFFTRNRVYLDIRSEKGYSYNFYQNYGDTGTNHNINIAYQSVAGVAQVYETNGWPILFSAANQPTGGNTNNLKIKLRIDDNTMPLIFIKNKFFRDTNENRKSCFITEKQISINGANTLTTWSKRIQFNFRNTGVGVASRPNVANYIKLNYFRQQHNTASPLSVLLNENYYDSAFCSIDLPRLGDAAAFHKTAHSAEPIHIREPDNPDGTGNFGLNISTGAFWDSNQVLFYGMFQCEYPAKTSEKEYVNTYNQKLRLANTEYAASNAFTKTEILCRSYAVGTATIRIPSINLFRGKDMGATKNHKENALFLGLTMAQVASLKADNQLSRLHHRFIHLQTDATNPQIDAGGHRYFRYTVQLQGMLNDANPTRVTPLHGGNPIVVHSRDNQFFSSAAFSAPEPVTAGQNRIEFHIFHNGCVKITDNKDFALIDDVERIYYVYYSSANAITQLCNLDVVIANKMKRVKNGSSVTWPAIPPIPAGYNLSQDYVAQAVPNVDAAYSYANAAGNIFTKGTFGVMKYVNENKKVFMVHCEQALVANAALAIDFTYEETLRLYANPGLAAATLGALVDITHPLVCYGFAFPDGTCYPSAEHVSGLALDTKYNKTLANDVAFIVALNRFGFKSHRVGNTTYLLSLHNHPSTLYTVIDAPLHNSHLHSTKVELNDCVRTL